MNENELLRVVDVDYLHDYVMNLEFSNGEHRIVDFKPLMTGKLREPLLNLDNFIQFALTDWTLEWYNGVDFAPEYLYENGKAA
ncbi:MAG: DUF2442 domain-containing protein [Bacteroidales bacterium]|nr:DUF2442 domain-containing protein [Bacteroidales bacterium]